MKAFKFLWSIVLDLKAKFSFIMLMIGLYVAVFVLTIMLPMLISNSTVFHIVWELTFTLLVVIWGCFDYLKKKWKSVE